jgi:hypothetical protein
MGAQLFCVDLAEVGALLYSAARATATTEAYSYTSACIERPPLYR